MHFDISLKEFTLVIKEEQNCFNLKESIRTKTVERNSQRLVPKK